MKHAICVLLALSIFTAACSETTSSQNAITEYPLSENNQNQETPTTHKESQNPLKELFLEIEYNKPQETFVQEIVMSSDVPQSIADEWVEIQTSLNSIIGSYNRYIMLITTTNEYSQDVFDRLSEVGWEKELSIVNGHLIGAGCLTGSGTHSDPPDPYNLCIMNYEFIKWPHDTKQGNESAAVRKAIIYHGWAHEYFHRYQTAHTLDRDLGTSKDCCGLRNPVESPAWYVEGAAIIFPDLWLRYHWKDFSAFEGLSFEDVAVEGMELDRVYTQTKREMNGLEPESRCDAFTADEEMRDTARCNWGIFIAYLAYLTSYQTIWVSIMEDINALGFDASFEKHFGMTKEEAYRSYNDFMMLESPSGSFEPPEGFFPEGPITDYVDFLSIKSGG